MAEEDWYRAIGALKRYRFFAGDAQAPEIQALIAECYLRGGQHFDAFAAYGRLLKDPATADPLRARAAWRRVQAAHLGGASLLVVREAPSARDALADRPQGAAIGYLHAHNLVTLGRWSDAASAFRKVAATTATTPLGEDSSRLALALDGAPRLHPKSPAVAGALAIIPGLGHVYAERYGDALNAFYPSAVLLTATGVTGWYARRDDLSYAWPTLLGAVALAFYSANIYSAVNVTRQANQLIVANEAAGYRRDSLLRDLERLDFEP